MSNYAARSANIIKRAEEALELIYESVAQVNLIVHKTLQCIEECRQSATKSLSRNKFSKTSNIFDGQEAAFSALNNFADFQRIIKISKIAAQVLLLMKDVYRQIIEDVTGCAPFMIMSSKIISDVKRRFRR